MKMPSDKQVEALAREFSALNGITEWGEEVHSAIRYRRVARHALAREEAAAQRAADEAVDIVERAKALHRVRHDFRDGVVAKAVEHAMKGVPLE